LAKQNTTKSLSSRRREHVSCADDKAAAAVNITSLFLRPPRFGRQHKVVRPVSPKVGTGDFGCGGHRLNAISLLTGPRKREVAYQRGEERRALPKHLVAATASEFIHIPNLASASGLHKSMMRA
jgi:hypothetical protein